MKRLFILSPAKSTGRRAQLLLNPSAPFALAKQFHRDGLPLAEVFTFASGLYFRGKIAYARQFADVDAGDEIRLITTNAGLVKPELHVHPKDLLAFGTVDIREDDPRFHAPLKRDAAALAKQLAPDGVAVLLGSIATTKYREVLLACFGGRLHFPTDFIGRGDMSRGALLLRAAREKRALAYTPLLGATLHGKRAPRVGK